MRDGSSGSETPAREAALCTHLAAFAEASRACASTARGVGKARIEPRAPGVPRELGVFVRRPKKFSAAIRRDRSESSSWRRRVMSSAATVEAGEGGSTNLENKAAVLRGGGGGGMGGGIDCHGLLWSDRALVTDAERAKRKTGMRRTIAEFQLWVDTLRRLHK